MSRDTPHRERRVAGSAAITAFAQVAMMAVSALLGFLVLLKFGKNTQTDGLFAAYGVYGFLALLAQSLRTTVVPRLVEGSSPFGNFDRFLGALMLIFLVAGIPLVALGEPLAAALTGDLGESARETARSALIILWLSAGAQFVAALSAAMLGVRSEFGLPALAYVAGGVLSVVGMITLSGPLGIDAVATAAAAGSFFAALVLLARLGSIGYRPRLAKLARRAVARETLEPILGGSAGHMIFYFTLIVSLAFAARLGEGAVTLYTYAFFPALVVMSASSGPAGVVLAAPLSQTWDRRPESLQPHLLAVYRVGLALALPVIPLAALVGDDIIELVLGSSLSSTDADTLVATFLTLSGMMVASVAMIVPMLAAFATYRYVATTAISGIGIAIHVGLSVIALKADALEALGAATSVSVLLWLVLLLVVVYGRRCLSVLRLLGVELLRLASRVLLAFVPFALLGAAVGGGVSQAAAAVAGICALVVLVRVTLPEHWELLARAARPLARRAVPA